jgi:hypothetical protein
MLKKEYSENFYSLIARILKRQKGLEIIIAPGEQYQKQAGSYIYTACYHPCTSG